MAKASPNMTAKANGPQVAFDSASGIMPMTVVMVVRNIGRRRVAADSTTMSMMGLLGLGAQMMDHRVHEDDRVVDDDAARARSRRAAT